MSVRLTQMYITQNPAYVENVKKEDIRYTKFQRNGPKGAVLHSIGVPQPSALVIANNFAKPTAQTSVHAVIQDDGTGFQLAPWNFRLWHVGGSANNTHVGIEMTEPACISYDAKNGYKLHVKDKAKALEFVRKTYRAAVELFAQLCNQYGWNPMQDGVIISHAEAYKRGWGSNHGDPEHLWNGTGSGYTMNTFRRDVKYFMENGCFEEDKNKEDSIMTQEQFEKMLQAYNAKQNDNDCGAWSKEARKWAAENGIIQGIGNGPDGKPNYAWGAPLTREQFVTMLHRFVKLIGNA